MIPSLLAYADATDNSASNMKLVLISAGILLAVVAVAFVPVAISRSRRHRQTEAITGLTVVWALLTAASLIYTTSQQLSWSQERLKRIYSGYYDPNDNSDAPKLPVLPWGGLAAAFCGLTIWAISQKRPEVESQG